MMILMPLSTSTEVNLDNSRLMPISTKMIIQKKIVIAPALSVHLIL